MARLIALYGTPRDPEAFDRCYRETHAPLVGAALASPQGQAAAADIANFASGGAGLIHFDSRDV